MKRLAEPGSEECLDSGKDPLRHRDPGRADSLASLTGHVNRIRRRLRSERDFDYFM